MYEMLIPLTWDQQEIGDFFASVPRFSVLLDIFLTHLTMHCLECLFHMDNHMDQVGTVTFVERISRQNSTSENICKTGT